MVSVKKFISQKIILSAERENHMGNGNLRIPKKMPIESGFQGIWENEPLW